MSAVIEFAPEPARGARSALVLGQGARAIAFGAEGAVDLARFAREVRAVAASLPHAACAVNLCEDRYRFLVAFCAAAVRGQTTLMPPSRAPAMVAEVMHQFPDSYCLGDRGPNGQETMPHEYRQLPAVLPQADGEPLALHDDFPVAIGFTSGSTGRPKSNLKTWAAFRASTQQNLAALADLLDPEGVTALVATVPPQHMYGLEMSILLPLLGQIAVHGARPFFPGDVARALCDAPTPPLLVTTPVHLRALVESDANMPALRGIVSATAPLSRELAQQAEARFGCQVRELFGSTETCVIARRRTAMDTAWSPLPGVRVTPQPDGAVVQGPHLDQPVVLADLVEVHANGHFELRGRNADLLEIAGKRASLGDLTRRLLAIPGVRDGVVFQMDPCARTGVRRIAAVAVAPGLAAGDILAALRAQLDPVFLPRTLRCVGDLPRNETGKLTRAALAGLLMEHDPDATACAGEAAGQAG